MHCAGARTVYYDDDPDRMAVAAKLGAEVHDINSKRENDFHLAVDPSADPERLRKALLSVMPEGYVNVGRRRRWDAASRTHHQWNLRLGRDPGDRMEPPRSQPRSK